MDIQFIWHRNMELTLLNNRQVLQFEDHHLRYDITRFDVSKRPISCQNISRLLLDRSAKIDS